MTNPLSLHHLTMLDAHPLELVNAAAAGEFEYVGLRLIAPTAYDAVVDVVGDPALQQQIDRRLADTGVQLLDIEAVWLQPDTNISQLLPALDVAQRLGARHVLTVGHDPERSRLLDNFCQLAEAAIKFDLGVALEFITYCSIGSLGQAISLLQEASASNTELLIDTLQFFRSGAAPEDLRSVDPTNLRYFQLCDAVAEGPVSLTDRRAEARTDRRLPGQGQLPIRPLIAQMPAGIPISIEAPTLALRRKPFDEQARTIATVTRAYLNDQQEGPA